MSLGGLDRIYAAMTAHGDVLAIQEKALEVLALVSINGGYKIDILSFGELDRLYAAMAAYVSVSSVQEPALRALAHLASNNGYKVRIVSSGGLQHIFAAMAAHVRMSELQWSGVDCLLNFSDSPANLPVLKADGRAAAALRTALAVHPTHADIQRWAPTALARLG